MEESKDTKVDAKPVEESPSRSKDLSKTLPEEAVNHFLQGKRHMLVQDYTYAVQSLAKACEMYTDNFGELALECGEVYFLYGKALFRLSQQQAGVLGGALNEDAAEDDEEEQEKSSEEEGKENESEKDSDTENGEENQEEEEADAGEESNNPSESTDSPQAQVEDAVKDSTEKEEQPNDSKLETTLNETADESQQEQEQEPEEDDLELAWNSLETAKTIFLRQGPDNVEAQLKIADIMQLLAEISMESDNNIGAIKDLEACLVIKERHLKDDDRVLAETYYQMGLAQMLEKMYKEALGNFMTTADILKKRKENLLSTPIPDDPGSFERLEVMQEVEDLDSVMSDIQEKIEDTRELILNASREIQEALLKKQKEETVQEGFAEAEKPASSSKPVSNITHLLKRKKPEQDDIKENETKRVKLTSIQNGDTTVTE